MTINQARIQKTYVIDHLAFDSDEDLAIRLTHLGFLEKEEIKVLRKTPFTGDCLLVEVRGSQLALTKKEAGFIMIREKV